MSKISLSILDLRNEVETKLSKLHEIKLEKFNTN
mgnify:CR=1 FL=1